MTQTNDIVEPLNERFDTGVDRLRTTAADAREAGHRYESRVRALDPDEWQQLSMALLLGFVALATMATLVAAVQPAVGLPVAALPLVVVTAAVGVVGFPLRWWDAPGGYALALLTGGLGLVGVGLIAAGVFGWVASGAAMITLGAYGAAGLALVGATYRSRPGTEP